MIFVRGQGVTSKFTDICLDNLKVPFRTKVIFTDLRGTLGRGSIVFLVHKFYMQ
jgi:hypothetical protein